MEQLNDLEANDQGFAWSFGRWKRQGEGCDWKIIGFIRQWLDNLVFHHISTKCSSKKL